MLISLVVSTLGRASQLEKLFHSLTNQDFKGFEVIVVDQNDDDRLQHLVEPNRWPFPVIHISAADKKGLSRGRNIGLFIAKGDIVLFPDDDCWYPPFFLKKGAELITSLNCSSVTGRAADEQTLRSINGTFNNNPTWIDRKNIWTTQIEWTVFFRRDAVIAVKGYDENMGVGCPSPWQAYEGPDLTLRLLEAEFKTYYDPSLYGFHAEHDVSTPDKEQLARGRAYARGHGHLLRKHRYNLLIVAYALIRPTVGCLVFFALGKRERSKHSINLALGRLEG